MEKLLIMKARLETWSHSPLVRLVARLAGIGVALLLFAPAAARPFLLPTALVVWILTLAALIIARVREPVGAAWASKSLASGWIDQARAAELAASRMQTRARLVRLGRCLGLVPGSTSLRCGVGLCRPRHRSRRRAPGRQSTSRTSDGDGDAGGDGDDPPPPQVSCAARFPFLHRPHGRRHNQSPTHNTVQHHRCSHPPHGTFFIPPRHGGGS